MRAMTYSKTFRSAREPKPSTKSQSHLAILPFFFIFCVARPTTQRSPHAVNLPGIFRGIALARPRVERERPRTAQPAIQSPHIFILSHILWWLPAFQACLPRALLTRRHRTPHALWAPPRWLGGAPRRLARAGVRAHASAVTCVARWRLLLALHQVSGRRCVGKPPGSAGRLLGSRARAAGGRRRRARWSRRASAIERATPRRRSARLRGCAAALRGCAEARRLGVARARLAALCTAPRRAGCPCGPYFCTLCISSLPRPPPRASPPRAGR